MLRSSDQQLHNGTAKGRTDKITKDCFSSLPRSQLKSIVFQSLFIWEQEGIQTELQMEVHEPYPEHNG